MVLAEVINDMNSNYETRTHGGYSKMFDMQGKMLEAFPQIGVENVFASEVYLPAGQKYEPESLEKLKIQVAEYHEQYNLESSVRKIN